MNYGEVFAKIRELLPGRSWSLDVEAWHYAADHEALTWKVYVVVTPGEASELLDAPTGEELLERVAKFAVGGLRKGAPDDVGEVALPEAPPVPSEIKAAEPAAPDLPW